MNAARRVEHEDLSVSGVAIRIVERRAGLLGVEVQVETFRDVGVRIEEGAPESDAIPGEPEYLRRCAVAGREIDRCTDTMIAEIHVQAVHLGIDLTQRRDLSPHDHPLLTRGAIARRHIDNAGSEVATVYLHAQSSARSNH